MKAHEANQVEDAYWNYLCFERRDYLQYKLILKKNEMNVLICFFSFKKF